MEEEEDLPFPATLSRATTEVFLEKEFDPDKYLIKHHQHQSLRELAQELEELLKDTEGDLVELVNSEYADFISLGQGLRGGDERVGELLDGVERTRQDAKGISNIFGSVVKQTDYLINRKREIFEHKAKCRRMLTYGAHLDTLEVMLKDERVLNLDQFVQFVSKSVEVLCEAQSLYERIDNTAYALRLRARHDILRKGVIGRLEQALSLSKNDDIIHLRILGLYRQIGAAAEAIEYLNR